MLLCSFKEQLQQHVRVHAMEAVMACWEIEQSLQSLTGNVFFSVMVVIMALEHPSFSFLCKLDEQEFPPVKARVLRCLMMKTTKSTAMQTCLMEAWMVMTAWDSALLSRQRAKGR